MAFPSVQGRDKQVSPSSDATSWTIPFPLGWDTNLEGDRVYCFVTADTSGSDTNAVLSTATAGWSVLAQEAQAQVRGAIFYYDVGSDNEAVPDLVVSSTTAEQFSSVALWLRSSIAAFGHFYANAEGSSTNSDPPSVTNSTGASIDALVVATRHGDSTVVPSAAPSGYSDWQSQAGGATAGASTDTAEKQATLANGASENPGTWTVTSEQWVCWTIAIYEDSGAGGGTAGYVKVWNGSAWVLKPVKVWNGSAWEIKPVKYWDGDSWELA